MIEISVLKTPSPRSPEMLDYLLKFDEEDDAEYKEKMIKMLENMDTNILDHGYESGINVLETYVKEDIGKNKSMRLFKYI